MQICADMLFIFPCSVLNLPSSSFFPCSFFVHSVGISQDLQSLCLLNYHLTLQLEVFVSALEIVRYSLDLINHCSLTELI